MHSLPYKKIGLMGGTFDPIHFGHLLAAERAREEFELEKVYFIPSGNPPHKNYNEMADARSRYKMVNIAIKGNTFFEISDIEFKRKGFSYTIDTVNQIQENIGEDTLIYFIIGTDIVGDILNWKDSDDLIRKVEFITMTRPGSPDNILDKNIEKIKKTGGRINVVEMPLIHIDSTEIRQRVMERRSIKYMVPDEIEEFIDSNKIYLCGE